MSVRSSNYEHHLRYKYQAQQIMYEYVINGQTQSFHYAFMLRVKGKVVPVIFLTEHHAMKAYWGMEV
jgi:hypothetical protein